jgi:endoglucanase
LLVGCSSESEAPEHARLLRASLTVPGLFFQGNNFSGAERGFGASLEESWGPAIPGVEGQTYSWPTPADNVLPSGMNIVRLPFQWERLQPTLAGDLDAGYLGKLHSTAGAWRDRGATVLLDVHNYAFYKANGRGTEQPGQHLGSTDVPVAAFADLWRRLALEFGSTSRSSPFIFGLMNEPHDLEVATWIEAAQAAVDAIRATGAQNPIFVPGADWTTAADFSWSQNATLLQSVSDPADNSAIEVHQYYDGTCTPNVYVDKLAPFEAWATTNHRVAFLGEFDVTDASAACQEAFANFVDHLHSRAAGTADGVWVGYTYWQGTGVSDALPFIQPHLPATCASGTKDGSETDADCGATCLRCADHRACAADHDCQSGFCMDGVCSPAAGIAASGGAGRGGVGGSGGMAAGGAAGNGEVNGGSGGVAHGGTPGDGGSVAHGGTPGDGGASGTGGRSTGAAGMSGPAPGDGGTQAHPGCSCRVARRDASPTWSWLAPLLGLLRRRLGKLRRREVRSGRPRVDQRFYGRVVELARFAHGAEQQGAAAHVASSAKFARNEQPLVEDLE